MSTNNICFCGEIRKIFTGYPPLSRPMSKEMLGEEVFQWHVATPTYVKLNKVICEKIRPHSLFVSGEDDF